MTDLLVETQQRLRDRVEVDEQGCWIWQLGLNEFGYGWFTINSNHQLAHRASYVAFVGPVPDGLDLDHLCRVRRCINPAHLEPVTRAENLRRGSRSIIFRTGKCFRGHVVAGENALTPPSKSNPQCRECNLIRSRERTAAEQEMAKRLGIPVTTARRLYRKGQS